MPADNSEVPATGAQPTGSAGNNAEQEQPASDVNDQEPVAAAAE